MFKRHFLKDSQIASKKVRQVAGDLVYNIIASAVPLFFLQFLIQPYVARVIGTEQYGGMLTVVGLLNIGIGMFGSPLNNARLIDNHYYINQKGDYNIFLSFLSAINASLLFLVIRLYQLEIDNYEYILLIFISLASVMTNYLAVEYRIKLDYKRIMLSKIVQTLGYCLGCLLFIITRDWEWIFFVGYGLCLVYIIFTTSLWKEPFRSTEHIKKTSIRISVLVLSASLGSFLMYFDRLLIFPLFGGTELTIYYAASIVGKTVALITSPLSSVLLSYIVHLKRITRKQFSFYIIILFAFAILGYIFCILISEPLIYLLYPESKDMAMQYVPYSIAASMFGVVYSFIWPFVLRFGKNSYPLLITVIKAILYLLFIIILVKPFRVMGVNYANLFATAIQAFIVIMLGFKVCTKSSQKNEDLII